MIKINKIFLYFFLFDSFQFYNIAERKRPKKSVARIGHESRRQQPTRC